MNQGAEALQAILSSTGNQKRLAESLSINQGYLSRVERGKRIPGLEVRRKLEKACAIPMQAWDLKAKKVKR